MRKRGKYEAVSSAAPKKNHSLLRAYVMSICSLLLTCAMFMGTTAAWFTTEVTNEGNRIQVGILSVDLFHGEKSGEETAWTSLKEHEDHKVFGAGGQKWKPGSSDVQVLKVVNDGQMLLGYQVTFLADPESSTDRDGNPMTKEDFEKLTGHFKVYTAPGENREFDPEAWECLGTLAQVMDGKTLYSGMLAQEKEEIFSVAVAMDASVDSFFMGHKLELYLKLTAYQADEDLIPVSDDAQLRDGLAQGGKLLLLEDITFDEPMEVGKDTVILFNGNDLTFAHEEQALQYAFTVNDGAALTLEADDSTVTVQNGLILVKEDTEASVTLRGGTYLTPGATGEGSGLIHIPNGEGVKLALTLENITYQDELTGWAVRFGDGETGILDLTVNGCAISAGHGVRTAPAGVVEIANSAIHAASGLAIEALTVDGVTVTDTDITAATPEVGLDTARFGCGISTARASVVSITGGSVAVEEGMYTLAILSGGGSISVESCTVAENSTFVHENAAGTVDFR